MNKQILVIASSGGHLSQALAATSKIKHRIIITNKKGIVNIDNGDTEVISLDTTKNIIIHLRNFFLGTKIFIKYNIAGVFSTGGPMCLPFLLIAKLLGKKVFYLDTMSRVSDLSNTGKLIYKLKLYDEFLVQWDGLVEKYKGVKTYGQVFNIHDRRDSRS